MKPKRARNVSSNHHRGAAVVQVAVAIPALLGFVALGVDVGMMYRTRAELQRTADAAALAAAAVLVDGNKNAAEAAARDYADRNKVLGTGVSLGQGDVTFGRAHIDEYTGRYVFTPDPSEPYPNAVRVRARRTSDSPSGPVALYFARIFGIHDADISARATAILTPRDIAFVLDLSTSLNDDTQLRSFKNIEIGNRNVWEHLWDGTLADSYGVPQPIEDELPAGPQFGNMNTWGDTVTDPHWDFMNDDGLVRLGRYDDWSLTSGFVSQTLSAQGYGTYTANEMAAINSDDYDDSSSYYRRRALVTLGVYRWKSGKTGGQPGGDGNDYIGSDEVELMVPYPSGSTNPDTFCKDVGGSWDDFVRYVTDSDSSMCRYNPSAQLYGDPELQYRFGLKTFVDYLQEHQYGDDTSPGLAGSPQQPMGAIMDAVKESLSIINGLEGGDLVALAGYATEGYGPSDKPDNMSWLKPVAQPSELAAMQDLVDQLQPGMWTTNTNIAQGIDKGVEALFDSPEARANAAKVLILLTDGIANQVRQDPTYWDTDQARKDALQAAGEARAQGVQIYTISVGANADQELMKRIADPTYDSYHSRTAADKHFHAEGSIATYRSQLQDIFRKLGTERPVVLIE